MSFIHVYKWKLFFKVHDHAVRAPALKSPAGNSKKSLDTCLFSFNDKMKIFHGYIKLRAFNNQLPFFLLSAGRIWREEFNVNVDRKYRNNLLLNLLLLSNSSDCVQLNHTVDRLFKMWFRDFRILLIKQLCYSIAIPIAHITICRALVP